jgi:hypothetical protein
MVRRAKGGTAREIVPSHEMQDQEVLRANKELVAYFKGRRTEREARAALKIIKAFIRDREHADPRTLRPLPGVKPAAARPMTVRKVETVRKKTNRKPRRPPESMPDSHHHEPEASAEDAVKKPESA